MSGWKGYFKFFLLTALSVNVVHAQKDAAHSILEDRYTAMKSAMAARDAQAISSMLAPEFVSIDISGKAENASEMIKELTAVANDPNKTSKTTLVSVAIDSNKASVEQRYDMKTKKFGQDGSPHEVELIAFSSDVWISSKGNWLLQRTETKQMDYTVDGKVLIHKLRN